MVVAIVGKEIIKINVSCPSKAPTKIITFVYIMTPPPPYVKENLRRYASSGAIVEEIFLVFRKKKY